METPNLDEAIAALRHDEGCSSGVAPEYRCRCRVEWLRDEAKRDLASLKAEFERLIQANEHWHLRVSQLLAQTEAQTDELATLRESASFRDSLDRERTNKDWKTMHEMSAMQTEIATLRAKAALADEIVAENVKLWGCLEKLKSASAEQQFTLNSLGWNVEQKTCDSSLIPGTRAGCGEWSWSKAGARRHQFDAVEQATNDAVRVLDESRSGARYAALDAREEKT